MGRWMNKSTLGHFDGIPNKPAMRLPIELLTEADGVPAQKGQFSLPTYSMVQLG